MTVADLAELGGALEDLLTRLGTWTHRAAPRVAELPDHHELREDTGTVDPTARCLQAADHLTQVAAHLAAAQAAARNSTPPSPTSPSTTPTDRDGGVGPGPRRHHATTHAAARVGDGEWVEGSGAPTAGGAPPLTTAVTEG